MKTRWIYALAALMLMAACTPEPFKDPDGTYDLVKGVEGTWVLTKVEIEDRSFPAFEKRDISDFLGSQTVTVTFSTEDMSYTVTGPSVGHPLGSSGFFAFDNPDFPTQMSLNSNDGQFGSTTIDLGNMVRAIDPEMVLLHNRSSCDQQYAQYLYTFNRQNQQ